jgi:hypothetical protein
MFQPNRGRQWQRIVQAGLCPGISTFEEYEARYTPQLLEAIRLVEASPIAIPQPLDLQTVHQIIFADIHPWAGQFRSAGQVVTFDGGTIGTDSHRIVPEIEKLRQDTEEALAKASTPQDQAITISLFHARIRRIHPFLDGNTRTSATLLEGQLRAIFGPPPHSIAHPERYKQLLAEAYHGKIVPLTNAILTRLNLAPIPETDLTIKLAAPMMDTDLETEWKKERETILKKQQSKK